MDAKQARSATKRAVRRKRNDAVLKQERELRDRKAAFAKGFKEYKEDLAQVRREIEKAADDGRNHVSVNIAGLWSEVHPIGDARDRGAQKKIKEILEAEGYRVETSQKTHVDEPFGSDPMFDRTMHWRYSLVDVSW